MAGQVGRPSKKVKETGLGRVRMFEVSVPDEGFSGLRERVTFTHGRAELPEPRPNDFFEASNYGEVIATLDSIARTEVGERQDFMRKYPGLESYAEEREAFRYRIRVWKERGYRIRTREIDVQPETPFEDLKFEG